MVQDKNIRTLPQVLAIAKSIIDSGREKEFVDACAGNDNLFVVSTEEARLFMASFLDQHKLDPSKIVISNFSYGDSRC